MDEAIGTIITIVLVACFISLIYFGSNSVSEVSKSYHKCVIEHQQLPVPEAVCEAIERTR
jgi:hypothetical protein